MTFAALAYEYKAVMGLLELIQHIRNTWKLDGADMVMTDDDFG